MGILFCRVNYQKRVEMYLEGEGGLVILRNLSPETVYQASIVSEGSSKAVANLTFATREAPSTSKSIYAHV
jgi:hypothetical protein